MAEPHYFCEHYISAEELGSTDPFVGTYCKLRVGHAGAHSALYPDERMATETMTGVALIAAERERQVTAEGWTPEHDDGHADGEIAKAAAVYAWPNNYLPEFNHTLVAVANLWPWERESYKPRLTDRVSELVKAGALIAAEIDRLQRAPASRDSQAPKEGE